MDLLLLGGMSPRNKAWIYEVKEAFAPLFNKCVVHEYAHWASEEQHMDLDHEAGALRHTVHELDDYVVFAKSAGAVLAIKSIAERVLQPKACLFAGVPLGLVRQHEHEMDAWLKSLDVPTIFAQNSYDPTGSFQEVERYLRERLTPPHYTIVELPGDTHSYDDLSKLKELMEKVLR